MFNGQFKLNRNLKSHYLLILQSIDNLIENWFSVELINLVFALTPFVFQ